MKPTQEQVIAWAREALNKSDGTDYYDYTGEVHWWGEVDSVVSFAVLAYEAGAAAEREACALAAEAVVPRHTECGNKIAAAIRARGQG